MLEWIYFNQLPEYNNYFLFTGKLERNLKNIISLKIALSGIIQRYVKGHCKRDLVWDLQCINT